jgi:hypothetical protein
MGVTLLFVDDWNAAVWTRRAERSAQSGSVSAGEKWLSGPEGFLNDIEKSGKSRLCDGKNTLSVSPMNGSGLF